MNRKEWLYKTHGIGKVGRGRISREGLALIDKAIKSGMVFDDMTVSKPKRDIVTTKKPVKVEKPIIEEYNSADVRQWARTQGIEVAGRGRIDSTIIKQYLDATPKSERAPKDSSEMDLRPSSPRRYPEGTTFTVSFTDYKGQKRSAIVNDRTVCMECKVSLCICACLVPGRVAMGFDDQSKPMTIVPNIPQGV